MIDRADREALHCVLPNVDAPACVTLASNDTVFQGGQPTPGEGFDILLIDGGKILTSDVKAIEQAAGP